MKPTKIKVNTGWYGTTINASPEQLKEIIGKPTYEDNFGFDKVNMEWEMELNDGTVFAIYDWKYYEALKPKEVVCWHIGGIDKKSTEKAKKEIMKLLGE